MVYTSNKLKDFSKGKIIYMIIALPYLKDVRRSDFNARLKRHFNRNVRRKILFMAVNYFHNLCSSYNDMLLKY